MSFYIMLTFEPWFQIELEMFHAFAVVGDVLITVGLSWTLSTTHAAFKRYASCRVYLFS